MRSIERVDKFLVLRSASPGNEVWIDFRAERPNEFPADLLVGQFTNCEETLYTPEFSVLIPPHQLGQTIHVRAILVGSRLGVLIDNILVLDRTFPFSLRAGQVGLATIDDDSGPGTTAFDNVVTRYGISDRDGDGVRDGRDMCSGTLLPEKVPTVRLGDNRFANVDEDLAFETKPLPEGPGEPGLSMLDTAGAAASRLLRAAIWV